MPIARFQMPDGRIARFEVPDGTTPEQAQSMMTDYFQSGKGASATQKPAAKEGGMMDDIKQGLGDLAAGAVRGAGSIGATILSPIDAAARAVGIQNSFIGRNDRRQAMDEGLRSMGADTDSLMFKGGKLGGEIAGTAGAGGLVAKGLRAVTPAALSASPRLAQLLQAIETGGFSTGASAAPTLAGKAADMGIRVAGGATSGAATAGLVNPEDAGMGAAIGGALPPAARAIGAAGKAVGRAVSGKPVSPEVAALVRRAEELGIDVPADRIVNSKPLNAISAGLNYMPFSGRAATESRMQNQLNTALSRTFGQDSDNVTMALRKAESTLGGEFDRVLKSNTVKVDNEFLSALAEHEARAVKELGSDGQKIIKNQIDEILEKAQSGAIDGQAAYNIKRTLDRIGKRNTPEAFYALDLKKDLMGALNRSLGTDEAAKFATTRQQYGSMLDLKKIAQNGVDGDVSIARVANLKNINNPSLQELADISAQFLKPREGQHGAAQRALAGLGVGSLGGLPVLAGTAAAGRLANTALNSSFMKKRLLGEPAALQFGLLEDAYRVAPLLGVSDR